jgi:arylformamidase
VLIPVPGADHFTIVHELRDAGGILTRQLDMLLPKSPGR